MKKKNYVLLTGCLSIFIILISLSLFYLTKDSQITYVNKNEKTISVINLNKEIVKLKKI